MLVLALETATDHSSVAVVDDNRPLAAWREVTHQDLLRRLAGEVRRVLAAAGRASTDLGLVAVGLGPGSFTSLRVGLATAKGICAARDLPLVGISSLAAMVWQSHERGLSGLACPLLDARRGEVYAGLFRVSDPDVIRAQEEFVATAAGLAERLRTAGEPVTLLGQADLPPVREARQALSGLVSVLPGAPVWPDAVTIAYLACRAFDRHGGDDRAGGATGATDLDTLRPIYVRKSYAEEAASIDLGLR
jgi:tRNA threonylcarbamoyladenosine biosynthesis protein TsaB